MYQSTIDIVMKRMNKTVKNCAYRLKHTSFFTYTHLKRAHRKSCLFSYMFISMDPCIRSESENTNKKRQRENNVLLLI